MTKVPFRICSAHTLYYGTIEGMKFEIGKIAVVNLDF